MDMILTHQLGALASMECDFARVDLRILLPPRLLVPMTHCLFSFLHLWQGG